MERTGSKKASVLRVLEDRQAKIHENPKSALFIKGHKTSQIVNDVLADLHCLKKPVSKKYNKKKSNNNTGPFDDPTSVEFFSTKNDSSLFMYGSHSKKRPHNLIIGRLFDYHILDMMEFGVSDFKPLSKFHPKTHPMYGSKPCFSITGSLFQTDPRYEMAANLFVDFYRGEIVKEINLQGLDHVISLSVGSAPDTINFRHYAIKLLRSGTHVPQVELDEIGPSLTLTLRREKLAAGDLRKLALRRPSELKPKKVKNITTNAMHDKMANVHVPAQDVEKAGETKKPKAFRNKRKRPEDEPEQSTEISPKKQRRNPVDDQ